MFSDEIQIILHGKERLCPSSLEMEVLAKKMVGVEGRLPVEANTASLGDGLHQEL